MSDRWLPVLAAVLGIVGGVLGAAVGGYIANEGQEAQFKQERAERIRDLRLATYSKFLRAAENEKVRGPELQDSIVLTAQLEVELVARNDDLRAAAVRLSDRARNWEGGDESEYAAARTTFIDLAHAEIDTDSG